MEQLRRGLLRSLADGLDLSSHLVAELRHLVAQVLLVTGPTLDLVVDVLHAIAERVDNFREACKLRERLIVPRQQRIGIPNRANDRQSQDHSANAKDAMAPPVG